MFNKRNISVSEQTKNYKKKTNVAVQYNETRKQKQQMLNLYIHPDKR